MLILRCSVLDRNYKYIFKSMLSLQVYVEFGCFRCRFMLSLDVFAAGLCWVSMFSLQVYVEFRCFRCSLFWVLMFLMQVYVEF